MPLTPEELAKLVNDYRTETEDGHARLRTDFRTYHDQTELTLVLMRDGLNTVRGRVDLMERTPQDVAKLHFSSRIVVAIVAVTGSLMITAIGVSNRVTGRIDALSARMEEQSRLQDERNVRAEKSIDALTRQMELLKYEQQRLREDVTGKGAKR
jgi:hypothetical protein